MADIIAGIRKLDNPGGEQNYQGSKGIMIGGIAFSVAEAVAAFFMIFKPLFINPIYHNADLDAKGVSYAVKLFGNSFLSEAEKSSGTLYFPLSGTILNIFLIYIFITGLPILCLLFYKKGYSFAKTGMVVLFGLKAVIGLMPLLVPFSNVRNSMRIFGAADAVFCLGICTLFIVLSNLEFADDMLFDEQERRAMRIRGIFGGIMFLLMAGFVVFEKFAMPGINEVSFILGSIDKTRELMMGYSLTLLLAISLLCAIIYIRNSYNSLYFYVAFGCSGVLSNLYALINKIVWINKTYKPQKKLANQGDADAIDWLKSNGMGASWWRKTIFLVLALVVCAVVFALAFSRIKSRLLSKPAPEDKKPAMIILICSLSLVLCTALSIVATLRWDKRLYGSYTLGAMDYMYLVIFIGITLFLAVSMLCGSSFAKWGTLALYVVVAASNFTTIFSVFNSRKAFIKNNPGLHGYDFIITGVLLILSLVCCLTIIAMFVVKEISNYMYSKQNS